MSAVTIDSLNGAERAALLMLALGEDRSGPLWTQLEDEEIRRISAAMVRLGTIGRTTVEQLLGDVADMIENGAGVIGDVRNTERILAAHLDKEQVDSLLADASRDEPKTTWQRLEALNPQVLANLLKKEYPQTVALVLSQLSTGQAAKVIAALPPPLAAEVVGRMLRTEPVQADVLAEVEETIEVEFLGALARANQGDPYEHMAEIFNALNRSTETRLLADLATQSEEDAERVRSLMFTFEDLAMLEPLAIQAILRMVDRAVLATALKGASEDVKQLFFSNMPERAARLLREDMETTGPVRIRDVDDAQGRIVSVAKELGQRGEITISRRGQQEELIA